MTASASRACVVVLPRRSALLSTLACFHSVSAMRSESVTVRTAKFPPAAPGACRWRGSTIGRCRIFQAPVTRILHDTDHGQRLREALGFDAQHAIQRVRAAEEIARGRLVDDRDGIDRSSSRARTLGRAALRAKEARAPRAERPVLGDRLDHGRRSQGSGYPQDH